MVPLNVDSGVVFYPFFIEPYQRWKLLLTVVHIEQPCAFVMRKHVKACVTIAQVMRSMKFCCKREYTWVFRCPQAVDGVYRKLSHWNNIYLY